ncbi:glycosyltransferase family 4 protein [Listeria fleischmannii]|uniref:Glycosyltransferase family 4 protein n=2 Tax=Listeria fleischmannii TaxID=1069827 RepID=A0A841YE49_9LIST|nr:glycosyltransferase family 4 protein [Listeria fleischmannii]EIA20030.1 glycosytransferase [Listeria fleischmannii subsp. coloradonensis]MBC1398428.1 glycosyltransferase family 4 protein [Listeria fleischmannii]MBC1426489.1 glycosyltransferase family 4 protein [Listeria fleischmannii]STY46597.1 Glycogen synthase [Listeria fleischmannii subsp. coloradonensis]
MNILMVGPDPAEKGGISTVISNFKQYYSSDEHKLYFLSSWSGTKKWQTEWNAIRSIRRIISQKQIDLVHFHVAQKGSFFRKALLKKLVPSRCKIIFHMHASQFDMFYKNSPRLIQLFIRRTFNQTDHVVVLGENWAEFYRTITKTNVSVIQNAVRIPEKSLFNPDARTIVTFGRIGERKGSYDLLQVAERIQPLFPDVRFVLYGDGETEKVTATIQKLGLKNVTLGGWISKKEQEAILKNTLLHFLPSYHEGLPMAILETMASGIPNLSTNVGDIRDAIIHGENGILTAPGDVHEMTKQLTKLLNDPLLLEKYAVCAREKIIRDFSIENYHTNWSAFYSSSRTW